MAVMRYNFIYKNRQGWGVGVRWDRFGLWAQICCPSAREGFPGGSDSKKKSTCNAGDSGSIPGSGRSPGEGNDYPLQYSCLENSMDRRAWQATVHGVPKRWTQLKD